MTKWAQEFNLGEYLAWLCDPAKNPMPEKEMEILANNPQTRRNKLITWANFYGEQEDNWHTGLGLLRGSHPVFRFTTVIPEFQGVYTAAHYGSEDHQSQTGAIEIPREEIHQTTSLLTGTPSNQLIPEEKTISLRLDDRLLQQRPEILEERLQHFLRVEVFQKRLAEWLVSNPGQTPSPLGIGQTIETREITKPQEINTEYLLDAYGELSQRTNGDESIACFVSPKLHHQLVKEDTGRELKTDEWDWAGNIPQYALERMPIVRCSTLGAGLTFLMGNWKTCHVVFPSGFSVQLEGPETRDGQTTKLSVTVPYNLGRAGARHFIQASVKE